VVVAVTGGGATQEAEIRPDVPGKAFDLEISVERYFPDFALDAKQQPYSKSNEPRNPAALLEVDRAGKRYRVFVLQSMPGLHRVDEIGRSFALLSVEPDLTAEIAVHREPAAPLALLGAVVVAIGVGIGTFVAKAGS
jgi:cytochrome c biogenesis protein